MKPRLVDDLAETDYRTEEPILSQSIVKVILNKSPAHALTFIDNNTETTSMLLGRAAHCLILEGSEVFSDRYCVAPECDRRTKQGKNVYGAFVETLGTKHLITSEDLALITEMDAVLKSNNLTKDLLINGKPEVSAFGQINCTDIKGRFDYYHPHDQIIVDLKTTLDASPEAVKKIVVNYSLHIQQFVYAKLHENITGKPPADFVFIFVEKIPPHGVAVFRIDPHAIKLAGILVGRALDIYQECLKKNFWPGYPETVQKIDLPTWYYSQIEATQ